MLEVFFKFIIIKRIRVFFCKGPPGRLGSEKAREKYKSGCCYYGIFQTKIYCLSKIKKYGRRKHECPGQKPQNKWHNKYTPHPRTLGVDGCNFRDCDIERIESANAKAYCPKSKGYAPIKRSGIRCRYKAGYLDHVCYYTRAIGKNKAVRKQQ